MAVVSAGVAARLERLPRSRYLRGLVLRISAGGFFELYDLFMSAYIALGLIKSGLFAAVTRSAFDPRAFASFVGAGFAGMFLGTLFFGWVSDRFGRKTTFTISMLWYSAATLAMALAPTTEAIDAWRFIAGIGIGVQLVTIDSFICEIAPSRLRGGFIALSQFIGYLAVPVVAFLAYVLVPRAVVGFDGWRVVAAVGALGGLAIWWLPKGLPESPRWLASRGRREDASLALTEIERRVVAETHAVLPAASFAAEPPVAGSWREIWSARYRTQTAMLVVFNFAQTVGFYGFASWVPIFLAREGMSVVHSLFYTLLIAVANPLGPLLAMRYADRFERKWQIVVLSGAIAVFGLLFAQARAPALIVAFGIIIALANAWFSCAFHAYQAELYPTRIRARAVGFVYSWSRFSAIFATFLIAAILARYGTAGVFLFIAAAMAVVAFSIGIFGRKTRGIVLEDLAPGAV